MPQSLANVLLHIVFSTKNRAPFLQDPAIREEMNGYMVGTLKAIECPSLIVRTVDDHLHCLCLLSRTMSIAKLVEEMKVESSSWAKKQAQALRGFHWQAMSGIEESRPVGAFGECLSVNPGIRFARPWLSNLAPLGLLLKSGIRTGYKSAGRPV